MSTGGRKSRSIFRQRSGPEDPHVSKCVGRQKMRLIACRRNIDLREGRNNPFYTGQTFIGYLQLGRMSFHNQLSYKAGNIGIPITLIDPCFLEKILLVRNCQPNARVVCL